MAIWTVLLKVPDGIRAEQVEAEVAIDSDDGKKLDFYDLDPFVNFAAMWAKIEKSAPKTPEEAEQVWREMLDIAARIHVASFDRQEVVGHFRGARVDVKLSVQKR